MKAKRDALRRTNAESTRIVVECARCFRGRRPERFVIDDAGNRSAICDACRAAIAEKEANRERAAVEAREIAKAKMAAAKAKRDEGKAKRGAAQTDGRVACGRCRANRTADHFVDVDGNRFATCNQCREARKLAHAGVVIPKAPVSRVVVAKAPPVRARMTVEDLALFATPVRIADLPRRVNEMLVGRPQDAWPSLVAAAHVDGLLESPGRGPHWVLTDRGRMAVAGRRVA